MSAPRDLDRTLAVWFDADAITAPPEPLAQVIESTRRIRPRPARIAQVGSHWVGSGSSAGAWGGLVSLRPAMVAALVALIAVALIGAALLVGSRLVAPRPLPHTYLNELTAAADLSMPMAQPALVPLLDGRVLVIGDDGDGGGTTTRALVYDPATGASEPTGPLESDDSLWVEDAVRLKDGRVLVIGNAFAQVFDPTTMQFAPAGPMVTPRTGGGIAVLSDGRVLIAGGQRPNEAPALSSAELLDPETLTFSPTGSMGATRVDASTAILPDGRVFVAPGLSRMSSEVYDPSTGAFSAAGTMSSYFLGHTAIALPDGRVVVLVSVGLSRQGHTEVWDPTSLTFSRGHDLAGAATSATLLDDGRILLVVGELASKTSIYDPAIGVLNSPHPTRSWHPSATRLVDGRVLIVGGLLDGRIRPQGGGTLAPGVPTVEIFR